MTQIKSFSIKRILLLMQKELYENLKIVSVGYVSFFGIATAIVILNFLTGKTAWINFSDFYIFGLMLTGFFISGMAFKSFRSKEGTMSYLSIPASILEKFLSMLLLTTAGLIIFYTLAFSIFDSLFIAAGNSLTGNNIEYFRFFDGEVLHNLLVYLIIQSVFLAGASMFRKVPLFFTVFWLFAISLGLMLYVVLLGHLFQDTLSSLNEGLFMGVNINLSDTSQNTFWIANIPHVLFYYITMPVFWAVTYFKLEEKEA